MHPITTRLRMALVTLAFIGALALSGIIVQKPHGGVASGVSIARVGGKMHLDDITMGFVSRKAGKGSLEY
jgi:hypothetical protein